MWLRKLFMALLSAHNSLCTSKSKIVQSESLNVLLCLYMVNSKCAF